MTLSSWSTIALEEVAASGQFCNNTPYSPPLVHTLSACHSLVCHSLNKNSVLSNAFQYYKHTAPGGLRWFQLYVYKDRKVTMDLVKRAERAGYKAFAVTVDTPQLGRREADIRNKFSLPAHLTMGNFAGKTLL